jgi:hypothetical protein
MQPILTSLEFISMSVSAAVINNYLRAAGGGEDDRPRRGIFIALAFV